MTNPALELVPRLAEPFYRVTIVRVEEHESIDRPWQKITDDNSVKEQYGYRPKISKEKVEREVLRAELPEIDLKAVVKAVHGL